MREGKGGGGGAHEGPTKAEQQCFFHAISTWCGWTGKGGEGNLWSHTHMDSEGMGVPCVFGLGFDKNTCMGQGHGVMKCSQGLSAWCGLQKGRVRDGNGGKGSAFQALSPW